jgi:pyrroloquinoline quinone biosynthesis protein B
LRVYAAPSIRKLVIEHNIVFGMLRDQVTWVEINPGEEFELSSVEGAPSGIRCLPFPVSSSFPHYARGEMISQLNTRDAQLGFRIQARSSGRSFVYMPAAPAVDSVARQHVDSCDVLLFDGTFWSDDELIHIQGGGRSALQMGHMPISGPDGSLRNLANVQRPRKIYIHVNNTNPILDEQSSEYHEVLDAGWEVARDGLEFEL